VATVRGAAVDVSHGIFTDSCLKNISWPACCGDVPQRVLRLIDEPSIFDYGASSLPNLKRQLPYLRYKFFACLGSLEKINGLGDPAKQNLGHINELWSEVTTPKPK
jgi:hypothetical protein